MTDGRTDGAAGNGERGGYGQWLGYADAGCYLGGTSRQTIWRMLRRGDVKGTRVGSKVLISRSSLDAYLARHDYAPHDKARDGL